MVQERIVLMCMRLATDRLRDSSLCAPNGTVVSCVQCEYERQPSYYVSFVADSSQIINCLYYSLCRLQYDRGSEKGHVAATFARAKSAA